MNFAMKVANRFALFLFAVHLFATLARAATVSWDGGGGNNAWETAANWSSNVLPAAADDVVITGTGEIIYSTGSTTIRSLQSSRALTITGGTLTLTTGASTIQGTLKLSGGTLSARGTGTIFNATGPITNTGGSVNAREGASISLPALTTVTADKSGHILFAAFDPGSTLDLPNLTQAGAQNFYQFQLQAITGGQLNAPKLTNMTGAISVIAQGANAEVDLSGYTGTLRNPSSGSARIEVRDGGTVLLPNVTEFDRVSLLIRGPGIIPIAQIRSIQEASLTIDGQTNTFPNLTNLLNSSVYVENRAHVSIPGVTQLARTIAGNNALIVYDEGSRLELPNLASVKAQPFYQIELSAFDGELHLPLLNSVDGAIDIYAGGPTALVDLPALTGTLANLREGTANIEASNGGTVRIPNLTDLHNVNLRIRDGSDIPTAQIRSFRNAELLLDATIGNFPALTDIRSASILVEGGAELTLNGVTQWSRTNSGSSSLTAYDAGSVLRLPNLTQASALNFYQSQILAYSGGAIELPQLSTISSGAIAIVANGERQLHQSARFQRPFRQHQFRHGLHRRQRRWLRSHSERHRARHHRSSPLRRRLH